ncbi:MAG: Mth938-like domain-containing protein [Desulfobacteraceae bacterium]|jgi:hypothetical protein
MQIKRTQSPLIIRLAWGKISVKGLGAGKDLKLWPGGGRPWDWTETKTNHSTGIQPADVAELLDHGCTTIILSQGMQGRLSITPETIALLNTKGVTVHMEHTQKAAKIYNDLAGQGIAVGGLFHSTC